MVVLMSGGIENCLGQIKQELAKLNTNIEHIVKTADDHETRIRSSETWKNRFVGAWGVLAAVFAFLGQHLWRNWHG